MEMGPAGAPAACGRRHWAAAALIVAALAAVCPGTALAGAPGILRADGTPTADRPPVERYLVGGTWNNLNNQRLSVFRAMVTAAELDLTFVLPHWHINCGWSPQRAGGEGRIGRGVGGGRLNGEWCRRRLRAAASRRPERAAGCKLHAVTPPALLAGWQHTAPNATAQSAGQYAHVVRVRNRSSQQQRAHRSALACGQQQHMPTHTCQLPGCGVAVRSVEDKQPYVGLRHCVLHGPVA